MLVRRMGGSCARSGHAARLPIRCPWPRSTAVRRSPVEGQTRLAPHEQEAIATPHRGAPPPRPPPGAPRPPPIGGPPARPALATPAIPLAVSGRPVAVALLVAGLAVLTALMIYVLERGGGRRSRDRTADHSWDGVRQAAVSAAGDGEQRAALVEAARGVARADGAQVWEIAPDGNLIATEASGDMPRERRLRLPETVRDELREDWPLRPGGLLGAIEGPVLAATG